MASSHGNSTHSESAKMEQIITEFFAKSLHIILECRSPFMSSRNFSGEQALSSPSSSSSSSSSVRPRDKWFNLALGECPAALENLDLWRQSNFEPLMVDVILVKRGLSRNQSLKENNGGNVYCSDHEELLCGSEEKVIERWIVQYDTRKPRETGSTARRSSSNVLHTLYKKSILLLRSLYATARLLPAYKIFRDLNSSGKLRPFALTHRLSSFVEPFTRREEAEMQRFSFTPVETSSGRLCLSVLYHSSVSDASSESSTPMSPHFIPDYVGSPLADPLKRFTSLPVSSPSSLPFSRRHSWSYDRYRASPPASFSPSPTHSEPPAANAPRFGPVNLPPQHPDNSSVHKTNFGYDEYYPSPNFTPSPSPSPPVYGNHLSNAALLRSESAPLCIPKLKLNLPPSPPTNDSNRPLRGSKLETSTGLPHTGVSVEKLIVKDDNKKHSGTKIFAVNSLQFSFSRSSSRSFHDDFDDSDFPCHFDVEDDDPTFHSSRPESFDQKGHLGDQLDPQGVGGGIFPIRKSQDAAVGALVRMLKKAPPLRQELSSSTVDSTHISTTPSQHNPPDVSSSSSSSILVASKTTADALEELRGYKRMKDYLLSQGGSGGKCNVAAGECK